MAREVSLTDRNVVQFNLNAVFKKHIHKFPLSALTSQQRYDAMEGGLKKLACSICIFR